MNPTKQLFPFPSIHVFVTMAHCYGAYERDLYRNATPAENWEDDADNYFNRYTHTTKINTDYIAHPYNTPVGRVAPLTHSSNSRFEYLPDVDALNSMRKRIAEHEYMENCENYINPNEEKPLHLPIPVAISTKDGQPLRLPTPRPTFERKQHYKTALEPEVIATFEKFGRFVTNKCATNDKFDVAEVDEYLALIKQILLKRNEELDDYYNNEDYKEQVATVLADMNDYRMRSKKRFVDLGINHQLQPLAIPTDEA
jgi:hypothetical protein